MPNRLIVFPGRRGPKCRLTFDMSGGRRQAKLAGGRPLDGGVPKATECLAKDRAALLAFYDFPAEHWIHIRSSNVIESSFATIRHRTDRTKGCLTRDGMLAMIYKLGQSAERSWRRLRGFEWLAKVVEGAKFSDGVEVKKEPRVRPKNQPSRVAA